MAVEGMVCLVVQLGVMHCTVLRIRGATKAVHSEFKQQAFLLRHLVQLLTASVSAA
jgi:hypothetical protein